MTLAYKSCLMKAYQKSCDVSGPRSSATSAKNLKRIMVRDGMMRGRGSMIRDGGLRMRGRKFIFISYSEVVNDITSLVN